MNNLTKIAALPTGGGCQSALRAEDRGGERKPAKTSAPQQLVPIMVALGGFKDLAAMNPQPDKFVWSFTVGDVATTEEVQAAEAASARRLFLRELAHASDAARKAARLKKNGEGACL